MVALAEPLTIAPVTTSADPASASDSASERDRLVERIRQVNPSASLTYLAGFPAGALALYLEHLESAGEPRGRGARWVRPGDTRAIVCWHTTEDE